MLKRSVVRATCAVVSVLAVTTSTPAVGRRGRRAILRDHLGASDQGVPRRSEFRLLQKPPAAAPLQIRRGRLRRRAPWRRSVQPSREHPPGGRDQGLAPPPILGQRDQVNVDHPRPDGDHHDVRDREGDAIGPGYGQDHVPAAPAPEARAGPQLRTAAYPLHGSGQAPARGASFGRAGTRSPDRLRRPAGAHPREPRHPDQ